MTHDAWAKQQGRVCTKIQGDEELWEDGKGQFWVYNRNTKRWAEAKIVPV